MANNPLLRHDQKAITEAGATEAGTLVEDTAAAIRQTAGNYSPRSSSATTS